MATVNVQVRPGLRGWEWRVVDGHGQLRLAGTRRTREAAVEMGNFWLAQVQRQGPGEQA